MTWHNTRHVMNIGLRLAMFVGLTFAACATALAHHSTAAYEATTITLKNVVVKKLAWTNPHSVLSFDVKEANGRLTTWMVESGSPSALSRTGWNRNSLKAGDVITVELFPAKNGAKVARLARVVTADGKELLDSVYKASPFDTIQKK